jgi:hydrogenase maturation protease
VRYLIGVGNCTASDDGIGPRIVELIAEQGIERGFRAIDLSSNSLNLVSYLAPDTEAILIVDSALMGLQPGETRFFSPDDVETRKAAAGFSTHEGDILGVIELARAVGYPVPRLAIMGIEPATTAPGIGLSPVIAERTAGYAAAAIERLLSL